MSTHKPLVLRSNFYYFPTKLSRKCQHKLHFLQRLDLTQKYLTNDIIGELAPLFSRVFEL